jgi:multidrug resistance efflux pump
MNVWHQRIARFCRGYHPVPLRRRAVASLLTIQACALGLVIGDDIGSYRLFILATFLALFNYLTPAGKVTVTGKVIEVTPNVTGQIVAIPVKTNVPVKTGDVLFQIDPAPFQYKVAQLQASLAAARQQTQILKSNYEQATANVAG